MKSLDRRWAVAWGFVLLVLAYSAGESRFPLLSAVACQSAEGDAAQPTPPAAQAAGVPAAAQPAADMRQYAQEVQELLKAGLHAGHPDLDAARRHYRAARALCPSDPRLYHACGLVLLTLSKNDEALVQFRLAVGQTGPFYPAAWQSLVRLQAATGRYSETSDSLLSLAKTLEQPATSLPRQATKEDCAEWMGRMMTYLQLLDAQQQAAKDAASKADTQIRALLAAQRRTAYESGKRKLLPGAAAVPAVCPSLAISPRVPLGIRRFWINVFPSISTRKRSASWHPCENP